jgi:hypothetical protein
MLRRTGEPLAGQTMAMHQTTRVPKAEVANASQPLDDTNRVAPAERPSRSQASRKGKV